MFPGTDFSYLHHLQKNAYLCIIFAKQNKDINNITKKKNEKDYDFFSSDADSNISISAIYSSQVRIEEQQRRTE